MSEYYVGLDLAQAQDFTAIAVLQRTTEGDSWAYDIRSLHRFDRGQSYPVMVKEIAEKLKATPLAGCYLAIDQTGVGRPIVDLFFEANLPCAIYPVTITAGLTEGKAEGGHHVPKKNLVAVLQMLLGQRRLRAPKGIPFGDVLMRELQNFQVKITAAGNETFAAWRENAHDDLVLAVALAAWLGEHCGGPWEPSEVRPEDRSLVSQAPPGVFLDNSEEQRGHTTLWKAPPAQWP